MKRDDLFKHIATLGPIGYLPVAPGTWGSLAAFIIYISLRPTVSTNALLVLFILPIGIIASSFAEEALKEKDSRHIIIDEACGFFVSVLFIPFSIGHAVAAFFLFRIFDILKPFPIKKIETTFSDGLGVMVDDIVAGIYANIILQIVKLFSCVFFTA